jgi:hypothetical protein
MLAPIQMPNPSIGSVEVVKPSGFDEQRNSSGRRRADGLMLGKFDKQMRVVTVLGGSTP